MKLEDIEKLWASDAILNREDLAAEALGIPKLHSKYYKIMLEEKRSLYILAEQRDRLNHNLEAYFLKTMTNEEREEAGLPDFTDKRILRNEVDKHIDRWPEMIQLKIKIGIQQDKIDFCKDILKQVHNRSFIIKDAINFMMFTRGETS